MADLQRYERISRSFFPSTAFRQLRHDPPSDALFARCGVNACTHFGYVVCATSKRISLYTVATSRETKKQMFQLFVGSSLMASNDVMDAAAMRCVVDTADTGWLRRRTRPTSERLNDFQGKREGGRQARCARVIADVLPLPPIPYHGAAVSLSADACRCGPVTPTRAASRRIMG